jgi:hypothetical protein
VTVKKEKSWEDSQAQAQAVAGSNHYIADGEG